MTEGGVQLNETIDRFSLLILIIRAVCGTYTENIDQLFREGGGQVHGKECKKSTVYLTLFILLMKLNIILLIQWLKRLGLR